MSISSRISSMEEHVTNAYNGLQGLGADLTGIDKNIENISMVLDDIYDSMPQVSGEGTSLTLEDTRVGKIKSTLKGNTSQITYSGKNLFNIEGRYETGTGITYTKNDDGSYTLNGTANGNNFLRGVYHLNEQHTLSYTSNVSNSNVILRTRTGTPSAQTGIQDQLAVSSTSGNLTSSKQFDFVEISIVSGTTLNNFKIYIQLEKGSSVTSFEPYTNGPSPNPDYPQEVHIVRGNNKINVTGRNLLQGVEYGEINSNSGVESDSTTVIRGTNYIPYDTSSTYYVSVNSTLASVGINCRFYNASKEYLGWSTLTGSGRNLYINIGTEVTTTDLTPKYFKFRQTLSAGPITSLSDNVMITTVNDMNYEPFGNTYNIDLPVENLYNATRNEATSSAVTYKGDTSKIYINGTPSGEGRIFFNKVYLNAGTYTFSGSLSSGSFVGTGNQTYLYLYRGTEQSASWTYDTRILLTNVKGNVVSGTFTISESNYYYLAWYLDTHYTWTNAEINYQVERGTKFGGFTPYGINPIELGVIGTYKDNLLRTNGNNLWNGTFELGGIDTTTGQNGDSTDRVRTKGYVEVKPNTTYTLSGVQGSRVVCFYNSSKTYLSYAVAGSQSTSGTFTTPNNTAYIRWYIIQTNTNIYEMLNKGSTALPYEPYGSGEWYKYEAIGQKILNGSESWVTEAQRYRLDNIIQGKTFSTFDENNPLAYCNSFKWGNGVSNNYVYGAFWYTANGLNLSMQKDENPNATTLANFKTWLESNNQKVYYVLATPTYTKITYEPLIDQLNELEKAMSKDGQTNISQVNNDLPFIISASALKEWAQ